MEETKIELQIYSPRWGHEDVYELVLTRDSLVITHGARIAKCVWRENLDPEWSGESLDGTLRNDSIYPPSKFSRWIARAWEAWRGGELSDSAVDKELKALADWLNVITRAKPDTEFWKKIF